MQYGFCNDCGESIHIEDDVWVDETGGDACDNEEDGGEGVHRPHIYDDPDTDTIPVDLDDVIAYLRESEKDDYHSQCLENYVEECEDHIYRAATRLRDHRVLLHYAADTLAMLREVLVAKGSQIPEVWTRGLQLLEEIDSETKRVAEANAELDKEED